MTYRLIIKGPIYGAEKALADHGFRAYTRVDSDDHASAPEITVDVESDYDLTVKLNRWFNDKPRDRTQLPAGSLLLWNLA